MIKILFHSMDGIGMGHIMRGINIAVHLRNIIRCRIVFVTNTLFTDIFEKKGFEVIRGGVDPALLYNKKISLNDYYNQNEDFLLSILTKEAPDILVLDVLLRKNVIRYANDNNIFMVYVLREMSKLDYFNDFKELVPLLNLVLLAYVSDKKEYGNIKKIFNRNKIIIVGNIYRKPDLVEVKKIKSKYKENKQELLVTITAGGGGLVKEVKRFFRIIWIVSKKIELERIRDKKALPSIRWIYLKGPLFRDSFDFFGDMEIYDYELNLPELFYISDLVISSGGYNSINEIISAGTPALIYPFKCVLDSQLHRAYQYAKKGFMKIIDIDNMEKLVCVFRKILFEGGLKGMKENYKGYVHKNAGRKAAKLIVKEYQNKKGCR